MEPHKDHEHLVKEKIAQLKRKNGKLFNLLELISYECRTPFAVIALYLELVLAKAMLPEIQESLLSFSWQSAQRLAESSMEIGRQAHKLRTASKANLNKEQPPSIQLEELQSYYDALLALVHGSRFEMETQVNIITGSLDFVLDQDPVPLNHQEVHLMKSARKAIKLPMAVVAEIKRELY